METSQRMTYREMLLSQNGERPETTDQAADRSETIRTRLEASRRELLDLGLRNPLLNYRPMRAKGVEIVGESAAQVFDVLVVQGKVMSFLADDTKTGAPSLWNEEILLPTAAADQSDNRLQTGESPENLDKRLLNTYRDANTSIEETGVNTLFLALGMLRWYEAEASQQARYAPLLLVPVRLERTGVRQRFTVQYTGEDLGINLSLVEKAKADFGLLLPGQDFLASDSGEVDGAGYISQVASIVGRNAPVRWAVEPDRIALGFFSFNKLLMYLDLDPKNPAIAENEIIAALFGDGFREPPSTIPGDAHLDGHIKPQDAHHVLDADSSQSLAIHDATRGSGRNMVIQGPPGTGKSQTITNIIAAAVGSGKRVLFVSEKMAALEVVKRRLDSIGLGQACLELHSNKTNKRQTLDELKRTLNLEESATAGQQFEFEDIARAQSQLNDYSAAVNTPVGNSGITPHDAFGELAALNTGGMPNPIAWNKIKDIGQWSGDDFRRKREVVDELRHRLQGVGVPAQHPFYGAGLRLLLPAAQAQLRDTIGATSRALETLAESSGALVDVLPLPLHRPETSTDAEILLEVARLVDAAPDLSGLTLAAPQWLTHTGQIRELLDKGIQWRHVRSTYDAELLPGAWDADLRQARQVLNTTGRSFLGRLFSGKYKEARRQLASILRGNVPKDVDRQIRLIDALTLEQQLRADINGNYGDASLALGRKWQGHNSDWETFSPSVRWWLEYAGQVSPEVVSVLQSRADIGNAPALAGAIGEADNALTTYRIHITELQSALKMDNELRFGSAEGLMALPFAEQKRVLDDWDARLPEIQDIIGYGNGVDAAIEEGLSDVVDTAERNADAATHLTAWFERAWYESIAETAFGERLSIREFNSRLHESRIERFQTLDRQSFEYNRSRVAKIHRASAARHKQLPDHLVRQGIDDDVRARQQQLRVLQREIEKKSRHKPVRRLLTEAGGVIQELKPVFMMSPLSIANYLAQDSVAFDLVVFDEASQVRPVDALGSLLRGEKAVVVGDSKQLPPTSFFDSVVQSSDDAEDEEDSVTADMESVLGLFASQGAPSRILRWHYRSRHESLIAVSNREFYDNNLVVFSSPDAGRTGVGLQYHHLPDAVYDRGRSRTNPVEAETVARAVMEHAARNPELSLGVAAFSQTQAQAIEDRVETLRRQDDACEEFFGSHPEEPFFVKNLENVQGDERDVIFISIGYGRDERGQVNQNFGPLNKEGGERRLNVLITRAKQQCHVFTNLRHEDISSQTIGMRALRTFLAYAESGQMPDNPYVSSFEVDSPFQRAVAARLSERGYEVHQEVASGGRFVDIGIVDPQRPGRYIIGIECDGASYHSSRSARDRDRLREQVLRGLGWELHRIWSTDWFRNPERELERAIKAIEQAKVSN